MKPKVLLAVAKTMFREYLRTPEAIFWSYGFPVVMAIVLGLAFREGEPQPVPVAVLQLQEAEANARASALFNRLQVDDRLAVRLVDQQEADRALTMGAVDLVIEPAAADLGAVPTIRLDPARPTTELARLLVERAIKQVPEQPTEELARIEPQSKPGSRYIDFLIPGLVGLNLLGSGMWGIGFNIVSMRSKQLLKRLVVTPMRRSEFLVGHMLSRLVLLVPEAMVVLLAGILMFGVPVYGSWIAVAAVVFCGGMAFSGLGLLVASRARTIEGVSGLMNLFMLPMWLLSGSFFSTERFPDFVQPLIWGLPLTRTNDALRDIMIGGEGIAGVWPDLAYLCACAVISLALAVKVFRWV